MISTELVEEDIKIENHLRPQMLSDYIGQEKVKENLNRDFYGNFLVFFAFLIGI